MRGRRAGESGLTPQRRAGRIEALDRLSRERPLTAHEVAEIDRLIAQEKHWRWRLSQRIAATREKLAQLEAWAA